MRPARLERAADRADAAVHHVARRDDVDAGLGLHQRLLRQHRHGLVVDDVAGRRRAGRPGRAMVNGSSATSVIRPSSGKRFFSSRTTRGTRPFGVERLAAVVGLERRLEHREQRHHRDAERHALLGHRIEAVERARAARRASRPRPALVALAVEHEHRQDQVARRRGATRAPDRGSRRRGAGAAAGWRGRAGASARARILGGARSLARRRR